MSTLVGILLSLCIYVFKQILNETYTFPLVIESSVFIFHSSSPVVNHIQVFQIQQTRILYFGRIMVFLFTKYIVKATHVFWVRAYAYVWANGVMTFLNNIRSSSTHVRMLEIHNFLALECIRYLKYDSSFCCTSKTKDLLSHIWNRR